VEPVVDYTKVEGITYKKSVAFVNNFIINTTQFLNRFSYLCEERLDTVSHNIQRLEIILSLLEAKLASIPGLSDAAPAPVTSNSADAPPHPPTEYTEEVQTAPVDDGVMKNSTDPRYLRYFKMIKNGVPLSAVKQKMMIEGYDPNVLDFPDAPSDYKGEPVELPPPPAEVEEEDFN